MRLILVLTAVSIFHLLKENSGLENVLVIQFAQQRKLEQHF